MVGWVMSLLAGWLAGVAWAEAPPEPAELEPVVPVEAGPPELVEAVSSELIEATLDNGLRVTIVSDPKLRLEAVVTRVGVGSAHEQADQHGLAHLVEHLMFAGTERFPREAWWDLQDSLGADSNAWTGPDDTTYHTVIPTGGVGTLLEMEADRMVGFRVRSEELDRERGVVLDELRLRYGLEPRARLRNELQTQLLAEHPYGRPVGGDASSLEAVEVADVQDFHRQHYGARNIHLVLVGPLEARALLARIEDLYAELHPGQKPPNPPAIATASMPSRVRVGEETIRMRENGLVWPLPPNRICADEAVEGCEQTYWAGMIMLALLRGEGSSSIQSRLARTIGHGVPVYVDLWQAEQGGLVTIYARRHRRIPLFLYHVGALFGALGGIVVPMQAQPTHGRLQRAVQGADTSWIDVVTIDQVRATVMRQELAQSWDPLQRALSIAAGTDRGATELEERLRGLSGVSPEVVLDLYRDWLVETPGVKLHVR